jgi:hypothetical protein
MEFLCAPLCNSPGFILKFEPPEKVHIVWFGLPVYGLGKKTQESKFKPPAM